VKHIDLSDKHSNFASFYFSELESDFSTKRTAFLLRVSRLWTRTSLVTDKVPYVVTHHSFTTLLALVAPFKILQVLVKRSPCSSELFPTFPLKTFRWECSTCNFRDILQTIALKLHIKSSAHVFHNRWLGHCRENRLLH